MPLGSSGYRPRRTGERKKKSARGCIVDANMSVIACVIVQKGEKDIAGLTGKLCERLSFLAMSGDTA